MMHHVIYLIATSFPPSSLSLFFPVTSVLIVLSLYFLGSQPRDGGAFSAFVRPQEYNIDEVVVQSLWASWMN